MAVSVQNTPFRWSRFAAVTLAFAGLMTMTVELSSPEQRLGAARAAADVTVRVVPRFAPSAEAIRRRALATENLRAVLARLRDEAFEPASPPDAADTATFERWRKSLVVEVHPTGDPERRRIRFLAPVRGRPGETTALVETVAAQYAGDLAAQRWYAAIDRLRAAEQAVDAALDDYLKLTTGGRTAAWPGPSPRRDVARAAPRSLPNIEAAPLLPTPHELEREQDLLLKLRADMLETLQPAHPQVRALEARLSALSTGGPNRSIQRLAAETELSLPSFDDAPPAAGSENFSAGAEAALRRLHEARAVVQSSLNELLEPAAAEFPVVSTAVAGLNLLELRPFWHVAACGLALAIGAVAAWPRRSPDRAAEPISPDSSRVAKETPPVPSQPPPPEPVVAPHATSEDYELIRTVEQAAAASGSRVLGVLVRRREPAAG